MVTETANELVNFQRFLGEQIQNGGAQLSPEESVQGFRAYQKDLARLKEFLKPALEALARGEGEELDIEQFKREVTARLAERGITD